MTQKRKPIESTPKHYFCLEWITLIVIQENSSNRKHKTKNILLKPSLLPTTWQFFVTFLGWLSDPFGRLSDLQLGDRKVTAWISWYLNRPKIFQNHLVFVQNHPPPRQQQSRPFVRWYRSMASSRDFPRKHPPAIQWLEVTTTFRSSPSHTVDGAQIRWSLTSWGSFIPLFTGFLYIPGGWPWDFWTITSRLRHVST